VILVVGATGTLGNLVTGALIAKGHSVRALTRNPSKATELAALGAEVVRGDLRDVESLASATRDVRTVVSAAHSMLGRGADSSEAVDDAGQRALIDAAKNAGVEHFIFTSVRGASLDHPVDFWRTKHRVERYLMNSGLAWTIVRPTAFIEMHAYELIGKAVLTGRRVVLFGPGTNARNFVAAKDVAALIVFAIEDETMRGQVIEIGGPENLSGKQVVETFEKIGGRKAKVTHLPLGIVRLLSRAFRPLHPGVSRVMTAGVVSETTDQTFDPTKFPARYPITPTALEEWASTDPRVSGFDRLRKQPD
jgi:uncharacterized protein YbjT (DUF2867 family)